MRGDTSRSAACTNPGISFAGCWPVKIIDRRRAGGLRLRLRRFDLRRLAADDQHARIGPRLRDDRRGVDQHVDALIGLERSGVERERRVGRECPTPRGSRAAIAIGGSSTSPPITFSISSDRSRDAHLGDRVLQLLADRDHDVRTCAPSGLRPT